MKSMKCDHAGVRAIALLLCAAMALPLASCKKKDKNKKDPLESDGTTRAQYVEETDPYFSDKTVEFQIPVNETRTLEGFAMNNGRIVGDKIYVDFGVEYIATLEERSELDHINPWEPKELKRSLEIRQGLGEGGFAVYSMDGKMTSSFTVEKNETIESYFIAKDGRIGAFLDLVEYIVEDDSEELNEEHEHKLVCFSEDGQRLTETVIESENPNLFDGASICELENGNLLILGHGGLTLLDPSGKVLGGEELEFEENTEFYYQNGKVYVQSMEWTNEGNGDMYIYTLREIDVNTGKLGNPQKSAISPFELHGSGEEHFSIGGNDGIAKCDLLSGTSETLVKYEETDILPLRYVKDVKSGQNGDLIVLHTDIDGKGSVSQIKPYLTILHKEEKNPYAGKRIVYAATCNDNAEDAFVQIIKEYNKRPESKSFVVTYTQLDDVQGFDPGRYNSADRLLLAMKSGSGPDVILNCAEYSQFNSDKILLDLNPYLDGASGIDRSKYYDNILRAFEYNGKLYQLPLSVNLTGLAGNPDLLGRPDGWTLSEMDAKLAALPDGVYPTLLQPMDILENLLYVDMDHYVDYSGGTANFDSDDFRALLEFANKFGGKISGDKLSNLFEEYDVITYDGGPANLMMQDGVCALTTMQYGDLRWYTVYDALCRNAPLMIGWPSTGEKGFAAKADTSVGISAFSDCHEEAFDFVSFLLTTEEKFSFWNGISVLRAGTDKTLAEEIAEYEYLATLYENDLGMIEDRFPLSEELADEYRTMIENVHTAIHTNPTVMEIVQEEAPAYFNGQKSAEEVSRTIQNRVKTLLTEQQ